MPASPAGAFRLPLMSARHTPPFLLVSALLSFPAASEAASRWDLEQVRRLADEGAALHQASDAAAPKALPDWVLTAPRTLLGAAATVAPPAAALPPANIHATVAGLSQRLAALAPTGEVDAFGVDMRLGPSRAVRGVHVYEVDDSLLKAFTLDTVVGPDEWVVVNLRGAQQVEFEPDFAGSGLSAVADRLIFNVVNASDVLVRSGTGLLLAPHADLVAASSGHWDGMVVADDRRLRGEIGRESLRERRAVPRPEPEPLTAEGMLLLSRHPRSA
ncbi:choice-of-anchor A family protein [Inhella crocodyli]|uniref:Choice-of-anchor A family protein n=2 Tax=Inhella crocodyli TaxID=2499851 RepID=A0A437LHR7_9BURK|nr:choice-of-anchor A family protein [Inhella crocodyli]